MAFVLDASVTIAWAFEDERSAAAHAFTRTRHDDAIAPSLWWFEVRNALIINERRGRMTEAEAVAFLRFLAQLEITLDEAKDEERPLTLARRHRLTFYDAAYLELAQREALPLATLDAALIRAARAEKVALV